MKRRSLPEWCLRLGLLACALVAVWAVWTTALAQTNGATNTVTNAAPVRGAAVDRLAERVSGREFVERHREVLSFGLSQIPGLQVDVLGNPLWQYLSTVIYFILAFGVSNFLDKVIKNRLRAWAGHTTTQWNDVLIGLADGPVKVIAFVILVHIGL